jgi:hypothetical protein
MNPNRPAKTTHPTRPAATPVTDMFQFIPDKSEWTIWPVIDIDGPGITLTITTQTNHKTAAEIANAIPKAKDFIVITS